MTALEHPRRAAEAIPESEARSIIADYAAGDSIDTLRLRYRRGKDTIAAVLARDPNKRKGKPSTGRPPKPAYVAPGRPWTPGTFSVVVLTPDARELAYEPLSATAGDAIDKVAIQLNALCSAGALPRGAYKLMAGLARREIVIGDVHA